MKTIVSVAALLLACCGLACAQSVEVKDAWIRGTVPAQKATGAFMEITGKANVRLVSAESPVAGTVEIGHIFKLGYKYAHALGLKVLDEGGKETPVIMGSYGIGVERVLCAAVELYNDANGMSLPRAIAPFDVVITPVNAGDAALREAAEKLYREAKAAGLDPLLDDRDERPGVKFKDADLIGIPYRITVGKKLAQGLVEFTTRRTRETVELPVESVLARLTQ